MATSAPAVKRDVVVLGASMGGLDALTQLFAELPDECSASLAVVLHRSPLHSGYLADILGRSSRWPIVEPMEPRPMERNTIYLAPRDHHLRMRGDLIEPVRGAKMHFARPAVDALFISAAEAHGPRVAGVILTGRGEDGVSGLIAIKAKGGFTIVQHPGEARAPEMPVNGLLYDNVDLVLPLAHIPNAICRLAAGEVPEGVTETEPTGA